MQAVMTRKIKQQTPMIHFQSGMKGAILRASEVKPKLDTFITEWMSKRGKKIPDSWKLNGNEALNYKLKFIVSEIPEVKDPARELYFGNMGQGETKRTVFYKNPVEVQIICFVSELRQVIDECLETFWLIHNFGTRQNRGLGCFALYDEKTKRVTSSEKAEALLVSWYGEKPVYKVDYRKNRGVTPDEILYDGQVLYQILKGGVNLDDKNPMKKVYIKSYLTRYFLGLKTPVAGEKRFAKAEGLAPAVAKPWTRKKGPIESESKATKYRYIRGLLGTTDGISYIDKIENIRDERGNLVMDQRKGRPKQEVIKSKLKISSGKSVNNKKIERVPSPVLYAVCDKTLFIIPNDPEKEVLGAEFTFSAKPDSRGDFKPKKGPSKLNIPTKDEFSMDKMFAAYVESMNRDIKAAAMKLRNSADRSNSPLYNYSNRKTIKLLSNPTAVYGTAIQRCKGGK